jgi:hypothetical protein
MQARKLMGRMRKQGRRGPSAGGHSGLRRRVRPVGAGRAPPAKSLEDQAFDYALRLFQDFHYPQAETNFGDFLAKYTNSTHRADAILYLARARLEQSNFNGAISLLQKSSAEAGGLQPDYVFWMAKARYAAGDLTGAAEGFATVARISRLSALRLEASYDEAEAIPAWAIGRASSACCNKPTALFSSRPARMRKVNLPRWAGCCWAKLSCTNTARPRAKKWSSALTPPP